MGTRIRGKGNTAVRRPPDRKNAWRFRLHLAATISYIAFIMSIFNGCVYNTRFCVSVCRCGKPCRNILFNFPVNIRSCSVPRVILGVRQRAHFLYMMHAARTISEPFFENRRRQSFLGRARKGAVSLRKPRDGNLVGPSSGNNLLPTFLPMPERPRLLKDTTCRLIAEPRN